MTIFKILGEEFLKVALTEREYKKLVAREGIEPAQITTTLQKAIEMHRDHRVVKAAGNAGHVYVPKSWIGKTVSVTLIECIYK